jgi:hypothetical protein
MSLMAFLTMVMFAGLWYGLGPDRLFQPELWQSNALFAGAVAAITVITRLFGGWVCAKVARIGRGRGRTSSVLTLAGIVLVLGLVMAFITIQKPEPTAPRAPGATIDQFFDNGREPTWLALFNPIAGACAVLIGGFMLAGGGGGGGPHARKPV